jgi:outer membrane lipoprotein-sorting protein
MKFIITIIMLLVAPMLHASEINAKLAQQAQDYLNDIRTIKAEFTQVAPNGALSTGIFYMQRPGLMRWQYHPPVPVLMVSRGDTLRFIDYELEQVSDIPLQNSVASLLAKNQIDFNDDAIELLEAHSKDKVTIVTATQKGAKEEGIITFEFEEQPFKLRNIMLTDAKGEQTNISLSDAEYNLALDKKLFVMPDPRLEWKRSKR